jgi:hypothetical protein
MMPTMRGSAFVLLVATACGTGDPPARTFYQREIEPILLASCAGTTGGGCHRADPADPFAFAAGNLDVTSFANVQRRRDLLTAQGAYGTPALLIKAVGNTGELGITYGGSFRPLEIEHSGGGFLQVGSDAYLTLLEWTDDGATEDGLPPPAGPREGQGACSTAVPDDFDDGPIRAEPSFGRFTAEVQPRLAACNAGGCHGAPAADFYVTCGSDDRQRAFNFQQARAFVDDPVDNSQLLQVPLAVAAGGAFHTGGDHFAGRDDADYRAVAGWAAEVGRLEFGEADVGRRFFADHVQPILLTRGCSFQACHSPAATNDFQLRSGSPGFFSAVALERNYEKLREHFMALEVPDARRGRAVAKTILGSFGGIAHRGGPVLETPGSGGAQPSSCSDPIDPASDPAYCVVQAWVDIERAGLVAAGEVDRLAPGDSVPIVYVARRASHVAGPLEFDTYQPGSDLRVTRAPIGLDGQLEPPPDAGVSLLAGCPGAGDLATVDVRAPDVRHDAARVVFAMRTAQAGALQVYAVGLDGGDCRQLTTAEPAVAGIAIHNFDPAWSPDGSAIVYASTRGADGGAPNPTRSRKLLLPQSDLFRMPAAGGAGERITFLTGSELSPQFMREGRLTMTTEKVSDGFYQLSGRRMNWDLTDYHPLLAQRAESPFADPDDPAATRRSIGYQQATEIREGFDGDFLLVLSDAGARGGAGALAIFNRSVGTFELDRRDPGYLRSVTFPDPAATGRVGSSTSGAYRSPFPLPDGRVMASRADFTGDLAGATSLDFSLVAIHPRTGVREVLLDLDDSIVEAVLAIRRPPRPMYLNRRQLVFGGFRDPGRSDTAVAHFPDAPLVFTLLNANLRRGRPVEAFAAATQLAVYEERPAPPGTAGPNLGDIFQDRQLLGRAPLASDGSARVVLPAGKGVVLELQDAAGRPVVTMREEHQLGPGENITFGIAGGLFDAVCGGCHGTVSGRELDVLVTPDALTGASQSLSIDRETALAP